MDLIDRALDLGGCVASRRRTMTFGEHGAEDRAVRVWHLTPTESYRTLAGIARTRCGRTIRNPLRAGMFSTEDIRWKGQTAAEIRNQIGLDGDQADRAVCTECLRRALLDAHDYSFPIPTLGGFAQALRDRGQTMDVVDRGGRIRTLGLATL